MLSRTKVVQIYDSDLTRVEAPITNHLRDFVPKNLLDHWSSVKVEACANTIFFLPSFSFGILLGLVGDLGCSR